MRLFDFIWNNRNRDESADTAAKRLQVLVALDRDGGSGPDFLPLLQRELIQVIRKYVEIEDQKVNIDFQRGQGFSTLEVNVELPAKARAAA